MARQWTRDSLLSMSRFYQRSCLLNTAAQTGLFDAIADKPLNALEAADAIQADRRATTALLDALVAIELLDKDGDQYSMSPDLADLLTIDGKQSIAAMLRFQGNNLRRWAQLDHVVKSGTPQPTSPSIHGEQCDEESFIEAMNDVNRNSAPAIVAELASIRFTKLLDIGGASGTWAIEFLKHHPEATATIFDLPHVIPMAQQRLAAGGFGLRISLAPGDFYSDPLPPNHDLAWISAIIHQNSRAQNRDLFRKTFAALEPAGRVLIRDLVMDESRTTPRAGALFAIMMLLGTEAGGTYTFNEMRQDLESAGFVDVELIREHDWMDSIVSATKPR